MAMDDNQPSEAMKFELLKVAAKPEAAARLGRLLLPGRQPVSTPNFFAMTSRGSVPHVTPDNVSKHLNIGGSYMALEDFIERSQAYAKREPPIYQTPSSSTPSSGRPPLHSFTATPPTTLTILAPRRIPAVPSPMGNTNSSISVYTSTGFQPLSTSEYRSAIQTLQPDIAIPMADLTNAQINPTSKRALRMAERTDEWIKEWFLLTKPTSSTATFAPVLPIAYSMQWEYLERLSEDYTPSSPGHPSPRGNNAVAGLAVYDPDIIPDLVNDYSNLSLLPRLSLSAPSTPHQVLRQISLGVDLFVLPFTNTVSDSGVALAFTFPPPSDTQGILPLGVDMSDQKYQTDLGPLMDGCTCYACSRHHRAYVHHLLSAREMLGWTLLQIHNHAVLTSFFEGIRQSLQNGEEEFEKGVDRFSMVYDSEFPVGSGERPRARGYHFKSAGGDEKRNKPAWSKFGNNDDSEGVSVSSSQPVTDTPPPVPDPMADGVDLEHQGLGKVVR
ncbi:tRNA-guanine(15) transglycosylase-like protein [Diplogelasinospora grovesii]|uniref:Queuine tRNA-ribosyltransferase accessory subunit 2 n=1 Tax=Diplogelasinospora grovesii TaxID=303347 RepID=A0AAN6SA34_9PEZI|nr:tRNA-guanine(15) transglycosylase-like protein [Diplogelasinospora grovesii]